MKERIIKKDNFSGNDCIDYLSKLNHLKIILFSLNNKEIEIWMKGFSGNVNLNLI